MHPCHQYVHHLGIPILVHENIGEFDIQVSDRRSAGVQIADSGGDLGALDVRMYGGDYGV